MPSYEDKINNAETAKARGEKNTSRSGDMGGKVLNPDFDSRMKSIGPESHSRGFKRGRIVRVDEVSGVPLSRVRFMYNPSTVSLTHPTAEDINLGENVTGENPNTQLGNVPVGSTSVSLLFDRTYEMWDSAYAKSTNLASRIGCYADVLALYQMLGITGETEGGLGQMTTNEKIPLFFNVDGDKAALEITTFWKSNYPIKPLAAGQMAYIYWGNTLKAYGMVDGMDVTYTHFNKAMIPIRCVVNLGLQLRRPPDALVAASSTNSLTTMPTDKKPVPGTNPKTPKDVGKDVNDFVMGR